MIDVADYTYGQILSGMLSRIPNTLDKREGSIIYDALAPAAFEFASLYQALAAAFEDSFVGTAQGNALDMRGAEMGIYRRDSVKALRLAKLYDKDNLGLVVPIGTRFATLDGENSQNFSVFQEISAGTYYLEAEEGGIAANSYVGELLPGQYIDGLARAELMGEPIVNGSDEESDEDYRARYLYKIKNEPADGNNAQYLQWALEYPGIGKAKVFPLWRGVNTVKVSILGTDDMPCSDPLVAEFQEYLDPGSLGLGNGIAPIGARVTVATVTLLNVDVKVAVDIADGRDATQINNLIKAVINKYFNEISYKKSKIYYMEVGAAILSVEGVVGITSLTLNNGSVDIPLGQEQRPILGVFAEEVAV